MELDIKIKMNEKLFLKDPYESALGRKIVKNGLYLINKTGFEAFTFKKLASFTKTTEASIYRYFENKHRLLIYIINWYWNYTEYQIVFKLNNVNSPETKIKTIITLLVREPDKNTNEFIPESEAFKLVMWESSKAYLTHNITKLNKDRLFKPYKDLSNRIANILSEYNPEYKYPISLATTLIEMSHTQRFFTNNLPSLTNKPSGTDNDVIDFLEHLIFSTINK